MPSELPNRTEEREVKFTCVDQVSEGEQSKVKQRIFQKSVLTNFVLWKTLSPDSFLIGFKFVS